MTPGAGGPSRLHDVAGKGVVFGVFIDDQNGAEIEPDPGVLGLEFDVEMIGLGFPALVGAGEGPKRKHVLDEVLSAPRLFFFDEAVEGEFLAFGCREYPSDEIGGSAAIITFVFGVFCPHGSVPSSLHKMDPSRAAKSHFSCRTRC